MLLFFVVNELKRNGINVCRGIHIIFSKRSMYAQKIATNRNSTSTNIAFTMILKLMQVDGAKQFDIYTCYI